MTEPVPQSQHDGGRLAAGITIILLGLLLLLDRAGMVDWADRTGWWPLIVVAFGAIRMATGSDGLRSGVLFVLVGAWGLLNEFGFLRYEESWPLLLVIVGGSIVVGSLVQPSLPPAPPVAGANEAEVSMSRREVRRLHRSRRRSSGLSSLWILIIIGSIVMSGQSGRRPRDSRTDSSDDVIRRSAVLGQNRTVSYARQLREGHLLSVMGDCDVDLTHAAVAPGEEAVIRVVAVMGSVKLRVPSDWIVDIRVVPAIGGIHDTRVRSEQSGVSDASPGTAGPSPRIVVRGFVMMGDVNIRN